MLVTNDIPLGRSLLMPTDAVNSVQTLKASHIYPPNFSLTINSVTALMTPHNTEGLVLTAPCTVRVFGARVYDREFLGTSFWALEDVIGSHACSLEARACV
jgi:hypothetical protein